MNAEYEIVSGGFPDCHTGRKSLFFVNPFSRLKEFALLGIHFQKLRAWLYIFQGSFSTYFGKH